DSRPRRNVPVTRYHAGIRRSITTSNSPDSPHTHGQCRSRTRSHRLGIGRLRSSPSRWYSSQDEPYVPRPLFCVSGPIWWLSIPVCSGVLGAGRLLLQKVTNRPASIESSKRAVCLPGAPCKFNARAFLDRTELFELTERRGADGRGPACAAFGNSQRSLPPVR